MPASLRVLFVLVAPLLWACSPGKSPPRSSSPGGCPADMLPGKGGVCLDRSEVTVASYAECVGRAQCSAPAKGRGCNRDDLAAQLHPVNCVDGQQAAQYCAARGRRLPTRDEWMAAAERVDSGLDACTSRDSPQGGSCVIPQGERFTGFWGNVSEWTSTAPREGHLLVAGPSYESRQVDPVTVSARADASSPTVGFRCALAP